MDSEIFFSILKKYEIKENNPEKIRQRLNKIRSSLHPDRSSETGDFESPDNKEIFLIISDAIEFLDNRMQDGNLPTIAESKALESIQESQDKLLEKMEEQNRILEEINKRDEKEFIASEISMNTEKFSEISKKRIKQIGHSNLIPKVSMLSLTGILIIIWFYPSTIENHPYLSQLIEVHSPFLTSMWFILLITTCILWYFWYLSETFQKHILQKMNDKTFQFSLFNQFINERKCIAFHNKVKSHDSDFFEKSDLIEYLNLYLYSIIKNSHFRYLKFEFDGNINDARILTIVDIKYYIPYYFKQILNGSFEETDIPTVGEFHNDELKSPDWKWYRYESRLEYKSWLDRKSFPNVTKKIGDNEIDQQVIEEQMIKTIENLFEKIKNSQISEDNKQEINLLTFSLLDSGITKLTFFQKSILSDVNQSLEQELKQYFASTVLLKALQKEIIKQSETASFQEIYQI